MNNLFSKIIGRVSWEALKAAVSETTKESTRYVIKNRGIKTVMIVLLALVIVSAVFLEILEQCKDGDPDETISTETQEASTSVFADAEVGEIREFGEYCAVSDPLREKEKIQWLVLEKQESEVLVISLKGIDTLEYHNESAPVTWDDSYIQKWLNTYFYENAFSESEKTQILSPSAVEEHNGGIQLDETIMDCIFLLSYSEVNNFIQENVMLGNKKLSTAIMRCAPTDSVKRLDTNSVYINSNGYCWWWLRNTSGTTLTAYYVNSEGKIIDKGNLLTEQKGVVRPAMRISIK